MARKPSKPATCGQCIHVAMNDQTLVCYRFPPIPVVIENKPQNMRCAVNATERACGEFKRSANIFGVINKSRQYLRRSNG